MPRYRMAKDSRFSGEPYWNGCKFVASKDDEKLYEILELARRDLPAAQRDSYVPVAIAMVEGDS